LLFLPMAVLGQRQMVMVGVGNNTSSIIEVDGTEIASRALKNVNLTVTEGVAHFSIRYYDRNRVLVGPINLTRPVVNGRIRIDNFEKTLRGSESRRTSTEGTQESAIQTQPLMPTQTHQSRDFWAQVNVKPQNKLEGFSIFIPVDPFRGLALRSGQVSERVVTLKTGEIIFPVFLVAEDNTDTPTGVKYSWAIVNKIVTEGQESFLITPQDVMKTNTGGIVRKRMISKLNFEFIISEGASKGIVVSPQRPQRMEFYVGWNIIPIQYKDQNGFPTQAILILLINNVPGNLFARGRSSSDDIAVTRENIVITNNIQ